MSEKSGDTTSKQLTLFAGDSLASLTVLPGSEKARKMTAHSGRKCLESLKKRNRDGLLRKILLVSLIWDSKILLPIWKVKSINGKYFGFQLSHLMPDISENEFGLLPTPTASQVYKKIRKMCPTEKRNEHGDALQARIGEMFPELIGMYFHPEFVEKIMGYPTGWTDLNHSEMPLCHK